MKTILGISALYYDSAAALLIDGEIVAAAQEERFTLIKHIPDFPSSAVQYCLEYCSLSIHELDAIVFYDKPLLKFERLLETYYAFALKVLLQFLTSKPKWLREKLFLKKLLYDEPAKIDEYDKHKLKLSFTEHHLSLAASAFYPSPYLEAAILNIDNVGEWATAFICYGKDNEITMLKEMKFPHSVGLLYFAFTYYLGFRVNSGEYKLMGLASYGNPNSNQTKDFIDLIKQNLLSVKDDGSNWSNQVFYRIENGQRKKLEKLFGFPALKPDGKIDQKHCNLAYAIKNVTEEIILIVMNEVKKIYRCGLSMFVGWNCFELCSNGKPLKENIFMDDFIKPAAGDTVSALGAAQIAHHRYFNQKLNVNGNGDSMKGAYLGTDYSDKEAVLAFNKRKAVYTKITTFKDLCSEVVDLSDAGNVVGWFQGRMEFDPSALENHSILGNVRNTEMQKKLSLKIKYGEEFIPIAPLVVIESLPEFFDLSVDSPYILFIVEVKEEKRKTLPQNYYEMDLWEKLYLLRSDVQLITHLAFSARVQTIHKETNPRYWELIISFKEKTGYGIVVNTSFNVRGDSIVYTPEDAYKCFMRTEMDYLVVNDFLLKKTDQPDWEDREKWIKKFKLD